jgi:hypothetical protein
MLYASSCQAQSPKLKAEIQIRALHRTARINDANKSGQVENTAARCLFPAQKRYIGRPMSLTIRKRRLLSRNQDSLEGFINPFGESQSLTGNQKSLKEIL